ncbi:MAG: 5-deoxy-glucuronate isomerase [Sporichthyaceae bacterium]
MNWHLRNGSAARGQWACEVGPGQPGLSGWSYTSLRTVVLGPGGSIAFQTGTQEAIVLPLAGSCTVRCDDLECVLLGRDGVFEAVSDFAYVPRDAQVAIASDAGGRFAVVGAVCERRLEPRYGPADGVAVELRGAGVASRQVNNFCTPATFEADRLIAVEVLTPGGNWSSWPPHKHDEHRPGVESVLEEIYYCELSRPNGLAYLRVYGTEDRPIDVLAEVGHGDVVLVPHGWHGPAAATPGTDLYYLNVMAGPHPERVWRICDDPAHAWVRDSWPGEFVDARLPMTASNGTVTE